MAARSGEDVRASNVFWHTGRKKLNSSPAMETRPWEFQRKVALGKAVGRGRGGNPESWVDYIDRHIAKPFAL